MTMTTLFSVLIVVLGCCVCRGQVGNEYATTDVMRAFVESIAQRSFALAQSGDSIAIDVDDFADKDWFVSILVDAGRKRGIVLYQVEQGPRIRLGIVESSTRYTAIDKDSVERRVLLHVIESAEGRTPTWTQISTPRERIDVLSREQALRLQSTNHASTQGALPPEPSSWWDDILEPVVFVGATVVTAVLLFTVRSQ